MTGFLDLALLLAVLLLLLCGFPVAFTLGGTALIFAGIGVLAGSFEPAFLSAIPHRLFGILTSQTLVAVPLFVFMGIVLERAGLAEELIQAIGRAFAQVPGGLGIAVFVVGMMLAASTGVVGATVATLAVISLPAMLKQGYPSAFACGAVAASGTLGQIIPPSIVLIILGDQISSAYQIAQIESGNFAPDSVTVSDLFAGAIVPGMLLVALFVTYQIVLARLRPEQFRSVMTVENGAVEIRSSWIVMAPLILVAAVLGSILFGIATPAEAAAIGAVGALLLAGQRKAMPQSLFIRAGLISAPLLILLASQIDMRLGRDEVSLGELLAMALSAILIAALLVGVVQALFQLQRQGRLGQIVDATTRMTVAIFTILIGATIFSLVFRGLGGDERVGALLSAMPGGTIGALLAVMAVMFLLGFFLDFLEILFIVIPLTVPALLKMSFADGSPVDPVWLGVLIALNLQTSFLTPPFGFALFYLRSAAPAEIRTRDIYVGVFPFVALQLIALVVLILLPGLATWLPDLIYG